MSALADLSPYRAWLETSAGMRWRGRVTRITGTLVESDGPLSSVGNSCEITNSDGRVFSGEVVGFRGSTVLSLLPEPPFGIHFGDSIVCWSAQPSLLVGDALVGRVIDGLGHPLDGQEQYSGNHYRLLDADPPKPLERDPIHDPIGCGIRAIDGFLTCGRGQRVGIFGGSGVGKSTLIGMMARHTSADLTVLALVGERGREVRHFLEDVLGEQGRQRSVVVVSTSDQSPLLRIRAALAATAVAEHFCEQGKNVLLVLDSLTRLAMAQREVGLAAGEPPTAKGYTPSSFAMMARLIERAGKFRGGSITAFYTVLMEGDDQQDPIVDGARALLDGHVVLDRGLAARGHYPPVAILDSISRLMSSVVTIEHRQKAQALRQLMATHAASEELVRIGAYQKGADPQLDRALAIMPALIKFLRQGSEESTGLAENIRQFLALEA